MSDSGNPTPVQSRLLKSEEEENTLRELCTVNGVKYNKLDQGAGNNVQLLELFFSSCSKLVGLHLFTNLTTLTFMGLEVTKISGLTSCKKLKEFWMCECKIRKIEGFEECRRLQRLYLYSNRITKIENLEHLKDLQLLWLSCNSITNIEGLNGLTKLRELNLSDNNIEKIGHGLNSLTNLEILNLSGNRICSFKDLTGLVRLQNLHTLGLKDPMYAPNPVCCLCNYSTHILYHLPLLQRLDTVDVSNKAMRELAEATVVKKKMYYNMRVKTLKRNMADMLLQLRRDKLAVTKATRDRIKNVSFMIKEARKTLLCSDLRMIAPWFNLIERLQEDGKIKSSQENTQVNDPTGEGEDHGSGTESDHHEEEEKQIDLAESAKKKLIALIERCKTCYEELERLQLFHQESVAQIKSKTDMYVKRLLTELETGGNVRFEDGKPSDIWFSSCQDLILARFCAADYKPYGILGIKIHHIMRVHNRMLRYKFDKKMALLAEDEESTVNSKGQSLKRLQEYLFFVYDPDLPGNENEPMRMLEEGCLDAETYRQLGRDAAVPLSNSLSVCEQKRIQASLRKAEKNACADPCPFRYGQLYVCKVFLGKSAPALDLKMSLRKDFYPGADSVFRPKSQGKTATGLDPSSKWCECSSRQCEWFIFDHEMVLPEYVIDFEYKTKEPHTSPFVSMNELKQAEKNKLLQQPQDVTIDDDVLLLKPVVKPRPRLIALTEELIMQCASIKSMLGLTVLNLNGNSLAKLKHVATLTSLKKLIISFNELTKLEDIAHMSNLEYVDASFNKLFTLDGLRGMTKMKYLDISWNDLTNTRDDLSVLRKHASGLTTLDLRHNSWQKPEGLRLRAIGRLKSLCKFNGEAVTEAEATAALRMAAGSRISQVSLLAHSRLDQARPRSLSLASFAQHVTLTSRQKPDRVSENDSQWYSKVTTLNLDGQHISKLSNIDRLDNLRWASFNNNDITKIEGLDNCVMLEELSLEDNCIYKLEGISKLSRLHTLNLGSNYIVSLENANLEKLPQLQSVSLENNRINSLAGLENVTSLIELYMGNNSIRNIREIFHLKNLPNFVILDLYGNPVAREIDNYRLYVVYHLKSLKALDGTAIESTEGNSARDTFGGRLTQDFVAERLGHANFLDVRELDVPGCNIRHADLGIGDQFINLRSINLEHNNLTSFSGLIHLINLRVLCLNHNHIEYIIPKAKQSNAKHLPQKGSREAEVYAPENYLPVLENLEVLHLGYNGISDLAKLQLGRLTSLKALFLQGNEISKVEGLEGLQDLRELVLDRNKIKNLSEYSFINQWNLVELHIEENRLRELTHFHHLENLQRLYLGSNRIQDIAELEKLEMLANLIELSVISNPVSRRLMHRPMLVFRQSNLLCIDGIPVSAEERTKAEVYFMEQQPSSAADNSLPGIVTHKSHSSPVKITNVQLQGAPLERHGYGQSTQFVEDQSSIQQDIRISQHGRQRRSDGRGEPSISPRNSGVRLGQRHDQGQSNFARQYHLQHQVPYVPHHGRGNDYGRGNHGSEYYRGSHNDNYNLHTDPYSRYGGTGGKGGRR